MYDIFPSYFNKKYDPFCGSLSDIIAVIAGLKPLTRLSFSKENDKSYQNFRKFVSKYGVFLVESGYKEKRKVPGIFEGLTHVYLSKSEKLLDFYQFFDPDLKISDGSCPAKEDIILFKKFAKDLGYPDCCVRNYLKYGQKKALISYFRSIRINHSPFYLNNFLHSISNHYLSFHLPCSLNCQKTKIYNQKIFRAIQKIEPEFARHLKKNLTLPLIAWFNNSAFPFDDRVIVLLDGVIKKDAILYSKCYILKTNYPNNKGIDRKITGELAYFKAGNKVKNTKEKIYIYRDNKLLRIIRRRSKFDGLLFDFY